MIPAEPLRLLIPKHCFIEIYELYKRESNLRYFLFIEWEN